MKEENQSLHFANEQGSDSEPIKHLHFYPAELGEQMPGSRNAFNQLLRHQHMAFGHSTPSLDIFADVHKLISDIICQNIVLNTHSRILVNCESSESSVLASDAEIPLSLFLVHIYIPKDYVYLCTVFDTVGFFLELDKICYFCSSQISPLISR